MKVFMKYTILFLLMSFFALNTLALPGAGTVAREITEAFLEMGGRKAARELAEYGGEKALKETLEKVAKESGEEVAEKMAQQAKRYGISTFKALSKNPKVLVNALDNIPPSLQKKAVLALERNTDEITEAAIKYGSEALEVAARQPGVGTSTLMKLGDDVVPVARTMNEKQFMKLTQYSDEIASLPVTEKKRLLEVLAENPKSIFAATIGSSGGILLVKDGKEMVFGVVGVDQTITVDEKGKRTTSNTGPLEKVTGQVLNYWPVLVLIAVIGFGFKALPASLKAYFKKRNKDRKLKI